MQAKSEKVFINPNFGNTHINPNFRNTHINPNFLKVQIPSSIHINPAFLHGMQAGHMLSENTTNVVRNQKIIAKSRTKLIREPAPKTNITVHRCPLIKIGSRKLVRASLVRPIKKEVTISTVKTCPGSDLSNITKRYKIDRRALTKISPSKDLARKRSFVSKYALSRINRNESFTVKKVILTKNTALNKKIELLNINGVLYKSTKNKLQKTSTNIPESKSNTEKNINERIIFVRGHKFILDKSGFSLTRAPDSDIKLKRIDIGGFTYVAKSGNVYVRTETHKTRTHLSCAKQKSINMLSKTLIKSNIPCPIFRKVGKCASFERGKCPKVHDKKHIAICSKFLKGDCTLTKCLLSHDVNLSKMPTCKFFLQKCCTRSDCPYLHKKLNQKVGICLDFLKGYCNLADKCNKRHEFLCPDFESNGKCEKKKCPYIHKKEKEEPEKIIEIGKQKIQSTNGKSKNVEQSEEVKDKSNTRYFVDKTNSPDLGNQECIATDSDGITYLNSPVNDESHSNTENDFLSKRPKLGELPAFIPL